jgi:hypothetical protein
MRTSANGGLEPLLDRSLTIGAQGWRAVEADEARAVFARDLTFRMSEPDKSSRTDPKLLAVARGTPAVS